MNTVCDSVRYCSCGGPDQWEGRSHPGERSTDSARRDLRCSAESLSLNQGNILHVLQLQVTEQLPPIPTGSTHCIQNEAHHLCGLQRTPDLLAAWVAAKSRWNTSKDVFCNTEFIWSYCRPIISVCNAWTSDGAVGLEGDLQAWMLFSVDVTLIKTNNR